jgi:hypothetical protein
VNARLLGTRHTLRCWSSSANTTFDRVYEVPRVGERTTTPSGRPPVGPTLDLIDQALLPSRACAATGSNQRDDYHHNCCGSACNHVHMIRRGLAGAPAAVPPVRWRRCRGRVRCSHREACHPQATVACGFPTRPTRLGAILKHKRFVCSVYGAQSYGRPGSTLCSGVGAWGLRQSSCDGHPCRCRRLSC